jgi:hypothetical protein
MARQPIPKAGNSCSRGPRSSANSAKSAHLSAPQTKAAGAVTSMSKRE